MTDVTDLPSAAIIAEVQAYVAQLGIFGEVNAHGPLNAPGAGLTAAVWVQRIRPVPKASGLDGVAVLFVLNMRCYTLASPEPLDGIDTDLTNAVDQSMKSLANGFTLQGLVRNIDLFGENGTVFDAVYGYVQLQGQDYRTATITIPCVVNDVWQEVA